MKYPKCRTYGKDQEKKKRGRPSTGFNKTAYQREYMRHRRAKAKAEKNGESDD